MADPQGVSGAPPSGEKPAQPTPARERAATYRAFDAEEGPSDAEVEDVLVDFLDSPTGKPEPKREKGKFASRKAAAAVSASEEDDPEEDDEETPAGPERGALEADDDEAEEKPAKGKKPAASEDDEDDEAEEEDDAGDDATPGEGEDDADEEIKSTEQLAKVFGVDEAELLQSLSVKVGDRELSLHDVIEGVRNGPRALALARDAEKIRDELTAERQKFVARKEATLGSLLPLKKELEAILGSMDEAEIEKLRESDPEGYRDAKLRLYERRQLHEKLNNELKAEYQRQEDERGERHKRYLADQDKALQARLGTAWSDPKVRESEAKITWEYLTTEIGYDPREIDAIEDHRVILLARAAALAHHQRTKVRAAAAKAKRGLRVPTSLKRTGRSAEASAEPGSKNGTRIRELGRRLSRTGSDRDADRLFEELV